MKRGLVAGALGACLLAVAPAAQAGVYSDDLGKCLVRSAKPDDQTRLVAWMFAAMARHPAIKAYASITPAQSTDMTKTAGALFQRLLVADCRRETVDALKYEGANSMEQAFAVLGQVAVRGLITDPDVAKGFSELTEYVDAQKMKDLVQEAGLPAEQGKAK